MRKITSRAKERKSVCLCGERACDRAADSVCASVGASECTNFRLRLLRKELVRVCV